MLDYFRKGIRGKKIRKKKDKNFLNFGLVKSVV